ncbi:probable cation-transporting ATPase 13A3 isoform X2 [Pollicipes pollicipes]|uniref:probable cation-transporting ATPase 13A3 isoform X2 n=1 Tax=Pollicipes pollicipes TaxID=41117 RepID=UPI001885108B|nr:probable cation-transporting ATPase 13A3 isoform X2 [Pollicipes pollicipes]
MKSRPASMGLLGGGDARKAANGKKHKTTDGDEISVAMLGFVRSVPRTALVWLCIVLTAGLLRLVFHWRRDWMLRCTHRRCHLRVASSVLVIERYKKHTSRFIHRVKIQRSTSPAVGEEDAIDMEKPRLYVPDMVSRQFKAVTEIRYFRHKKLCHVWNGPSDAFERLELFFSDMPLERLHEQQPLSAGEQDGRRAVYGGNSINIQLTPILKVIFLEVLTPFYVFQICACILWFADEYVYYASAIAVASVASVTTAVYQQRKNEKNLRRTIQQTDVVEVVREDNSTQTVQADRLVPGDVIVVPSHNTTMCCDAVLLAGNAIVNESMLTGESVPVTKVPLPARPDVRYSPQQHGRHTLFAGTLVLQTRYYKHERVLALVTRTGFMTSKGELVRSILYPPPVDFKLEQDTYKFVGMLAAVAVVGVMYSTYTKVMRGLEPQEVALDVLDLITIVVPPALPYAMAVGIIVGVERLLKQRVFCISPRSINIAGLINYVCFDKTGTLTEDGLDMKGVVRVSEPAAPPAVGPLEEVASLPVGLFTTGMAACHGLMLINSELTGDPLDLKMFESTGWELEEPDMDESTKYDVLAPTVVRPRRPDLVPAHLRLQELGQDPVPFEVGLVRQFVFASSLQRMSVLTRRLGAKQMELFCKGSPEMIISLSDPATVPADIHPVLDGHTQRGFRVLALAHRALPRLTYARAQRIAREEVERELTFLGLMVFENRLKAESRPVLRDLAEANIKTIMVTGDNMLTALSVAHDCGLLPAGAPVVSVSVEPTSGCGPRLAYRRLEQTAPPAAAGHAAVDVDAGADCRLAVTGPDFDAICRHFRELLPRLTVRGAVFARMRPDQKQHLVECIKELGYYVGMCGDGANDCGALKAAHTGVSLSEAEASVASPFTSQETNISCVPTIIREGRSALVTSFGIFKYMAAYSLTQFISVLILYEKDNSLTDFQFLYIDFFIITMFAGVFGMTKAYPGPLSKRLPTARLVSVAPILSLALQVSLVALIQLLVYWNVQQQPWFVPYVPTKSDEDDNFWSHENFAVYCTSSFQYILLAVVFSRGPPFRRRLYTNPYFSAAIALNVAFCAWCVAAPMAWMSSWLELRAPPSLQWRLLLLGVAVGHAVLALLLEHGLVEALVQERLLPRLRRLQSSQPAHVLVTAQLAAEGAAWPPLADGGRQLSAGELLKDHAPRNGAPMTILRRGHCTASV